MGSDDRPIGMFDSGIGGLTVMREVMSLLPNENVCYFGDTARVPYGSKSPETIIRYSLENASLLMEREIKLLVVACNTASAYAIPSLQEALSIPVIGVIEPGARKAVSVTKNGRIAVLGTRATIQSGAYQSEIAKLLPSAEVFAQSCPLFVPLVEENFCSHAAAESIIEEYLTPLKLADVDTVLLGCTHYPLLAKAISAFFGNAVTLVDSATTCAERVQQCLTLEGIARESCDMAKYHYFVSDDPERFISMGTQFIGKDIQAEKISEAAIF